MTERLPYEEQLLQQMNALPLPDVNLAWADMKRRLEEDDDDRIIPFWRRGCIGWVLLLVVLLGIGWWWLQLQKTVSEKKIVTGEEKEYENNRTKKDGEDTARLMLTNDSLVNTAMDGDSNTGKTVVPGRQTDNNTPEQKEKEAGTIKKFPVKKRAAKKEQEVKISVLPGKQGKKENTRRDKVIVDSIPGYRTGSNDTARVTKKNKPDSTGQGKTDTLAGQGKPDSLAQQNGSKKKNPEKVLNFFSAGLALHQQLPVDGQQLTPYNSLGRKGTLADYIPSVYFRFNHGNRWFLQTGFRYGAPQYNKEFVYDLKRDASINTDTVKTLKKTYYHQLPLTFNYKLLPGLTIGAGLIWNKFSSAVVQEKILKPSVVPSQDTLLNAGIIKLKVPDSVFSKSYLQATTELQYKWKRFSLGVNYSFGLQPYIRFSLPGGVQQKERNSSLQLFLRYELWKSKER